MTLCGIPPVDSVSVFATDDESDATARPYSPPHFNLTAIVHSVLHIILIIIRNVGTMESR